MRPTLAAGPREFKLTRAALAPSIKRMRALAAALLVIAAALPAWAQSPLVAELRVWSTRYNENVQKIDELRTALEQAAQQNADLDTLLALSQVCFMYGDVRAKTPEEKLESYDRGRQAAKRAIELAPKSAHARFWYGTNTGRWGQTKGIMRSLFLLPTVKGAMETALELDPGYAPAYALGGSIYYEVPGFAGGDLDRSETLFRKGLDLDPHYTNMRVGLARTLSKKGRVADARREALAVLAEKAPSNPADWIVKDVPQAKALLDQIKERP
jgi:tetratricopeptide (TPR) repeat protein